jgi:DNA-binding transcriptional regulator LsrR (DeoR family)
MEDQLTQQYGLKDCHRVINRGKLSYSADATFVGEQGAQGFQESDANDPCDRHIDGNIRK